MKIRVLSVLLLAALLVSLFTACGSGGKSVITEQQAYQIALEDAGLSERDVSDLHSHAQVQDSTPVFNIHFTYHAKEYDYIIHVNTGEILSSNK